MLLSYYLDLFSELLSTFYLDLSALGFKLKCDFDSLKSRFRRFGFPLTLFAK